MINRDDLHRKISGAIYALASTDIACWTTHPTSAATVGSENVVFVEYMGMGLFGFVVSQLTSTTMLSRRVLLTEWICSRVRNGGIGVVR